MLAVFADVSAPAESEVTESVAQSQAQPEQPKQENEVTHILSNIDLVCFCNRVGSLKTFPE